MDILDRCRPQMYASASRCWCTFDLIWTSNHKCGYYYPRTAWRTLQKCTKKYIFSSFGDHARNQNQKIKNYPINSTNCQCSLITTLPSQVRQKPSRRTASILLIKLGLQRFLYFKSQ